MTDLPVVDEITVCTACWCNTKGVIYDGDVLCGAVFGAILKKEGKYAED